MRRECHAKFTKYDRSAGRIAGGDRGAAEEGGLPQLPAQEGLQRPNQPPAERSFHQEGHCGQVQSCPARLVRI